MTTTGLKRSVHLLHLEVKAYFGDVVELAASQSEPAELMGRRVFEPDRSPFHRGGHHDRVLLGTSIVVGHDGLVVEVLESLELSLDLKASTSSGLGTY